MVSADVFIIHNYPPCMLMYPCIRFVIPHQPSPVRVTIPRGVRDGGRGWAAVLHDHGELYECAGYDYVLDLYSEMEVPPAFPYSNSYILTNVDPNREGGSQGLRNYLLK